MHCARSRFRRSLTLLLGASLLASGSCGDDDEAGKLIAVRSTEAWLDDAPAASGDGISFGAVLETNRSGVADFELGSGRLACRLQQSGEIRVGQRADAPIVFVVGSLLCSSKVTDENRPRLEAAGRIVEVGQASVNVELVEEGPVVVRNAEGDVTVDDVPLEAGDEIPIDQETGEMGPPVPIALPPGAQEVLKALDASLPSSNETETVATTEEQTEEPTDPTETETTTEELTEETTDPTEETTEVGTDGTGGTESGD
jgi:hypothetical protein